MLGWWLVGFYYGAWYVKFRYHNYSRLPYLNGQLLQYVFMVTSTGLSFVPDLCSVIKDARQLLKKS